MIKLISRRQVDKLIASTRIEQLPLWFTGDGIDSDVVLSTRIRLARNLAKYSFPSKNSLLEKRTLFAKISGAVGHIPSCQTFVRYNLNEMDDIEKRFLFEKRMISHRLLKIDGDRGVICDQEGTYSIMINEEDHIRLHRMLPGFDPKGVWEGLNTLDEELGNYIEYAFDEKLGFLTSSPLNAGTGMRISVLLHLPGLIATKSIDTVLSGASQLGIAAKGFFSEYQEVIGSLFLLANHAALGASEEEFIESTIKNVKKVVELEREARKSIVEEARTEIIDKICRSFGILKFAKTLHVDELMNLTSAIRLGIESSLINNISISALNKLQLKSMPAHIEMKVGKTLSDDEIAIMRADFVRNELIQPDCV